MMGPVSPLTFWNTPQSNITLASICITGWCSMLMSQTLTLYKCEPQKGGPGVGPVHEDRKIAQILFSEGYSSWRESTQAQLSADSWGSRYKSFIAADFISLGAKLNLANIYSTYPRICSYKERDGKPDVSQVQIRILIHQKPLNKQIRCENLLPPIRPSRAHTPSHKVKAQRVKAAFSTAE